MTEYIDRGSLVDYFKDTYGGGMEDNTCIFYQDVIRDVCEAPAADVAPVVHGKWDDSLDSLTPYCSVCSCSHRSLVRTPFYCPHCGAKMDLEE